MIVADRCCGPKTNWISSLPCLPQPHSTAVLAWVCVNHIYYSSNTVVHQSAPKASLAEITPSFAFKTRTVQLKKKKKLLPGETSHGSFQDGQVGFAPWPTLPLFLTKHLCWQMDEWSYSGCEERSSKLAKQWAFLWLNGQGPPLWATEEVNTCVSSTTAHISNFLLTTKAIRKLLSLTPSTGLLFIRYVRARPLGCWFITANKANGREW